MSKPFKDRGEIILIRYYSRTTGSNWISTESWDVMDFAEFEKAFPDYTEATQFLKLNVNRPVADMRPVDITDDVCEWWIQNTSSSDFLEYAEVGNWPEFIGEKLQDELADTARQDADDWARGPDYYYGVPSRL